MTTTKSLRCTAVALLAALPLAGLAQQPAQPGGQQPGQGPATSTPEIAFMRADTNGDGKLSKPEAARLPAVAQKFDTLDKDKDGTLSMAEYMTAFETPKQ
jgi:EF hand